MISPVPLPIEVRNADVPVGDEAIELVAELLLQIVDDKDQEEASDGRGRREMSNCE